MSLIFCLIVIATFSQFSVLFWPQAARYDYNYHFSLITTTQSDSQHSKPDWFWSGWDLVWIWLHLGLLASSIQIVVTCDPNWLATLELRECLWLHNHFELQSWVCSGLDVKFLLYYFLWPPAAKINMLSGPQALVTTHTPMLMLFSIETMRSSSSAPIKHHTSNSSSSSLNNDDDLI